MLPLLMFLLLFVEKQWRDGMSRKHLSILNCFKEGNKSGQRSLVKDNLHRCCGFALLCRRNRESTEWGD